MSYVGELGWELYVPSEFALAVFDSIAATGTSHGLTLAGYHALNSLRIEKAYRHWGHDISDEDTPLEAGLMFAVDLGKPGGFIGEDALLRQKEQLPTRRLVQFLLDDPGPLLYHDEPIWRDGHRVGRTTSGMYGYTLGAAVGLGYVENADGVDAEHIASGRYEIEVAGKRFAATASLRPMYDPASERTHA